MTAGRDEAQGTATVAGRAATLNGRAAGGDTGVGGGLGVRPEWMCAREVAELLGAPREQGQQSAPANDLPVAPAPVQPVPAANDDIPF